MTVCRYNLSMELRLALLKKGMSVYRLASSSGIPYMTVNDLVNGATPIAKAHFSTVVALAKALGIACEDLIDDSPYVLPSRPDLFASSVQHSLKREGALAFLSEVLSKDQIGSLLRDGRLFEARYLLALVDYLLRLEELPRPKEYRVLRHHRFNEPIYMGDPRREEEKERNRQNAIPEFLAANIIEGDVFNVA